VVKLYDKKTRQYLGRVSDEDLQFLIDHLEEESLTDTDYYINRTTLEVLKGKGMNEDFARLIENAMGGNSDIDIAYERV